MNFFDKLIIHKTGYSWLLIVGITLAIYSGTLSYKMLYNFDDDAYIKDYHISQLSSENVKAYFSGYYLGMYQPLPVLSFALVNHFFPDSMPAQRATNILLHCLNALLVLLLIRKITGIPMVGWLAALIFAVHPMHVESVSWLSTRSNLMYSFFYLLSLLFYANWQTDKGIRNWSIMFAFFALALFSKVSAASLPFVIVLLDWYKGKRIKQQAVFSYLPLFLLSLIFIRIGITASGAFGHITELGHSYSLTDKGFLILQALWLYASKAFIPINQSVIYLFPWHEAGHLPVSYYVSGIIMLATVILLCFLGFREVQKLNRKTILFGLFFFLITISMVLPLKWSRTILLAERYTYIPYIGLTVGVLLILNAVYQKSGQKARYGMVALAMLYCSFFIVRSYARNKVWENPITLFSDVINKNRSGAEVSMGYFNRGNEYLRLEKMDDAIGDYSNAVRIFPTYSEAFYNRGLAHYYKGELHEAISDFSSTIRYQAKRFDAFVNRGVAYRAIGEYNLALADFNHVISEQPAGNAYLNRGVLFYFNLGNPEQACMDWERALQMGVNQAGELLNNYCN